MLKKLLKYDMRAVARVWWIIAAGVLVLAVFGGLCLRGAFSTQYFYSTPFYYDVETVAADGSVTHQQIPAVSGSLSFIQELITIVLGVLAYIAFLGMCIGGTIAELIPYYRAYKSLYSDEGSLTFMLPVRRRLLIDEKLLHGFLWTLISLALLALSFFVFWLSGMAGQPDISELLSDISSSVGAEIPVELKKAVPLIIAEFVILLITSSFYSSAVVLMCLTIGSVIARKHKLISGIGIYYAVSMVSGLLISVATVIIIEIFLSQKNFSDVTGTVMVLVLIGALIVITSVLAVVCRALTQKLVKKQLNLA